MEFRRLGRRLGKGARAEQSRQSSGFGIGFSGRTRGVSWSFAWVDGVVPGKDLVISGALRFFRDEFPLR